MSWHLAPALDKLLTQINAAEPHRDRRSDGTIGDTRHQAETFSDHNPDASGTVCALDITHGPYWKVSQLDCNRIRDDLIKDKRVKYVIFQRRIWTPAEGWHNYSGVSPHLEHLHISVTQAGKNSTATWNLPKLGQSTTSSIATHAGAIVSQPQDDDNMDDMPKVYTIHPSPNSQEENYLVFADMTRKGAPDTAHLSAWKTLYGQVVIADRWASDVFKSDTKQIA